MTGLRVDQKPDGVFNGLFMRYVNACSQQKLSHTWHAHVIKLCSRIITVAACFATEIIFELNVKEN